LVVGLGNPGPDYQATRHNAGFWFLDSWAGILGLSFRKAWFRPFLFAETSLEGNRLILVKPLTFMNLSGRAVRAILDFYKLPLDQVLVVCDDFNLPLAKLRARAKGSHGGQNGLRNIQEQLGSDAYARLRIGVGQPGVGEAIDFVLSRFKPGERAAAEEAVASAAQGALLWAREGIEACMNRVNGTPAEDGGNAKKKTQKPKGEKAAPKDEPST